MLWAIKEKTLLLLFLMGNIKLDGMSTNIKLTIQAYLTLYFKFWEGTFVKSYKIQLSVLLFLVLHLFLYQQISFFSQRFIQHYLKKIFVSNFPFWIDKICQGWQNILANFPQNAFWNIFFQNLLTKSCKSVSFVSVVNWYCTYILKVPTTDSLVFFFLTTIWLPHG